MIGRLADGVEFRQAAAGIDVLSAQVLAREHGDIGAGGWQLFTILLGAVGLVLLLACSNIAGLMLARASRRTREYAVRGALGASRAPVAVVGREHAATFAVLLTALTALLTGLAPGLYMYRAASLAGPLASRAASASRHRLRGALVSVQLAFALILLLGVSLFLRSLLRVHELDPGYDASGVLTARLTSLTNERAKTPAGQSAFYREALTRVRAIPGVRDAAWAAGLPLTVFGGSGSFQIRGRTDKPGEAWPHGLRRYVTPGFLNVLRVPLHRGRFFTEADRENSEHVCVIDERLARQYWPDRDPIGDEITVDGQPRARIVGVIGHISQGSPSASDMKGEYLFPLYQHPRSEVAIAIRTAGGVDPLSLATALRETLQGLAPAQAVYSIRTLQDRLDETLAGRRLVVGLLGLFAAVALVLGGIGVFGVAAHAVAERTAELGLRLALGATRAQVLWMLLAQGLRLAAAGVCAGLTVTAVAMPLLRTRILFEMRDLNAWLVAATCTALVTVVALATSVPAYRATTIDPAIALRGSE